MLEKYLQQKGITADMIYRLFPDIEDAVRNYFSIKDMAEGDEYDAEMNKLSSEIVDYLKNNDALVEEEKAKEVELVSNVSGMQILEIPEIIMPGMNVEQAQEELAVVIPEIHKETQAVESNGYIIHGAMVTPHIWMKILSLSGIDYKWKVAGFFQYWIGDKGLLITSANPFQSKITDIMVFAEDEKDLENLYSIVQSKILSFFSKSNYNIAIDIDSLSDAVTSDSSEPVTKIPYKLLDDAMVDLWKIKSMDELIELISLSKKYGCGCGSI